MNAVKITFPDCEASGCSFYFVQALWRHANRLKLFTEAFRPTTLGLIAGLSMLAFIPIKKVQDINKRLKLTINDEYNDFFDYFEKIWWKA